MKDSTDIADILRSLEQSSKKKRRRRTIYYVLAGHKIPVGVRDIVVGASKAMSGFGFCLGEDQSLALSDDARQVRADAIRFRRSGPVIQVVTSGDLKKRQIRMLEVTYKGKPKTRVKKQKYPVKAASRDTTQ